MTPAQNAILKAYVEADPVLSALPPSSDSAFQIAAALAQAASPDFVVWRTQTPTADIFDAVIWANLTPTDAADGTTTWMNRNLHCQSKQLNLQTMLVGRDFLATGKTNVRAGLQDALTNLPAGVGGAAQSAGWTAVRTVMQRLANVLEKLFATGVGSTASPATVVVEGALNYDEVKTAMGW